MRIYPCWRNVLVLMCVQCLPPLCAGEILRYLPQDPLGFAIVRDVQTTNSKLTKLLGIFAEAVPPPLDVAQAMTGLSAGLNLKGDALFALLPAADPSRDPAPMFLLPVADYPAFAESIRADATGEICRVTIAEEDVLVAKCDDYALLMNIEHRELMQRVLAAERMVPTEIGAHHEWIAGNNVTAIVTGAGIAYLTRAVESETQTPSATVADPFGEPPFAGDILHLADALPFAELFARDVQLAGIGLAIDESTNSSVRWVVKFDEAYAESAANRVEREPFAGFADVPYALAGGGELPAEFAAVLPAMFTALARNTATQDGREDFTDQDWADVQKSYELWSRGLQAVSFLLTPGKEREPILSILFARLTVDDAQAYLQSLKKSFDLSNQLAARTKSDIKLNFEISPTKIAEAEGIEVTCDLGKATGDGDLHFWQAFLTSLLGIDHKLSMYFCATDNRQVFFAMEAQDKLAAFIEGYRRRENGLLANPQAKQTVELLYSNASWTCLVNPQGIVELVRTAIKSMQVLGIVPEFPLYPAAPPLGLTLSADTSTWRGEIVMPVEAARAMAQFTKETEVAFR